MDTEYYPVSVKIDGKTHFLIYYYLDGGDRFLIHDQKLITGIESPKKAQNLPNPNMHILWQEAVEIDVDLAFKTLRDITDTKTSFSEQNSYILNCVNILEDFLRSFEIESDFAAYRTDLLENVYDKIFWGNNLPAMTPEGESYQPNWKIEELEALEEYMLAMKQAVLPKILESY